MPKTVVQPFPVITGATMTGTATITSPVTDILYKDNVAYAVSWTGNPVGTFQVQGSVDYKPGLPQSDVGGPQNNGTWTTVPAVDASGNPPAATGTAGQILMNLVGLCFPFVRLVYTNISGAGVLTGYVSGKSTGL